MIIIKDACYEGTRILLGNEKRNMINAMIEVLLLNKFTEISMPIIQFQNAFAEFIDYGSNHMVFLVQDNSDRKLRLAPEYTAIIQKLVMTRFKYEKDLKLFYLQECFRVENPKAGRYRQFTQLGVEILHPTTNQNEYLIKLAQVLIAIGNGESESIDQYIIHRDVQRGQNYYKNSTGFEITFEGPGAQKQVCNGGSYEGGIGFALCIDRLLLAKNVGKEEGSDD